MVPFGPGVVTVVNGFSLKDWKRVVDKAAAPASACSKLSLLSSNKESITFMASYGRSWVTINKAIVRHMLA